MFTNTDTNRISRQEYFKLSKKSNYRCMASPSFRHFYKSHITHLHAVMESKSEGDEPLCSFIQRGSKILFYRGDPDWNDWMRQTPKQRQPKFSVCVLDMP